MRGAEFGFRWLLAGINLGTYVNLSIIIPTCNDNELWHTVKSIRDTAGTAPEIVIVDDLSSSEIQAHPRYSENVVIVRNRRYRLGVGAARHIGALHASGDYLLFIDSHMRFCPGWYSAAIGSINTRSSPTLYCATCLGLDEQHMDPENPVGIYEGATLNIFGPDLNRGVGQQVMEVVWNPSLQVIGKDPQKPDAVQQIVREDGCEIACVMGAGYIISRCWFLELAPLRFLRGWGGDELQLSLKAWLSGGTVRLMKNVRIGHKFTDQSVARWRGILPKAPTQEHWPVFNKLFSIRTMLPEDLADRFESLLELNTPGATWKKVRALAADFAHVIETERAENRKIFTRDFRWFCNHFHLAIP